MKVYKICFPLKKINIFAVRLNINNAPVAELVDALDSKSCSFGSAGSIPARGTKNQSEKQSEREVLHPGFFVHSHTHSHTHSRS